METYLKSTPTISRTATLSVQDFLVKAFRWQESDWDSKIPEALSSLKLPELLERNGLHFYFWKMSPDCYRMTKAGRLKPSSPCLLKWGIISNGVCITAPISECRSKGEGCTLSDILIADAPDKYFLSNRAILKLSSNSYPPPQGQRIYDPDGIACTLCAGSGGWGGKTGLYFIDMNNNPVITDEARCITARQDSGISNHKGEHSGVLIEEGLRSVINPYETMLLITVQDRHGKYHTGRVRKLMPVECWRLQGFTDEQFCKAKATGLSDGLLYKMAGNAVTVPVITAIGKKILEVNKKYNIVGGVNYGR